MSNPESIRRMSRREPRRALWAPHALSPDGEPSRRRRGWPGVSITAACLTEVGTRLRELDTLRFCLIKSGFRVERKSGAMNRMVHGGETGIRTQEGLLGPTRSPGVLLRPARTSLRISELTLNDTFRSHSRSSRLWRDPPPLAGWPDVLLRPVRTSLRERQSLVKREQSLA